MPKRGDDAMSDHSEDYDIFNATVYPGAAWRTTEDPDMLIAKCIQQRLGATPLFPSDGSARG